MKYLEQLKDQILGGELAVFHEFHRPPYGGGNQFLLALISELRAQGIRVSKNRLGSSTKALLVNSFNFDKAKVEKYKNLNIKLVHRVDGPVSVYRSLPDDKIDRDLAGWNSTMADFTIFQSHYSKDKHEELGITFGPSVIIPNAVNPLYFFSKAPGSPKSKGKIRIAGTSWSTNPKKGLGLYTWLDKNIDFNKYEINFMGRIEGQFKNIKTFKASGSKEVGSFLREHDIYFMPSQSECCSNALIEALTSGLPSVYVNSGSNPELVGEAGEPFLIQDEIPILLEKVSTNLDHYRSKIIIKSIHDVTRLYRNVLESLVIPK